MSDQIDDMVEQAKKVMAHLEPYALENAARIVSSGAIEASQAISLKRIADALEAIVKLGQPPYMVSGAVLNPDLTPSGVIYGEHTGDTRRPKESP